MSYILFVVHVDATSSFIVQQITDKSGDWQQPMIFQKIKNSQGNPISDNTDYKDNNQTVCMNNASSFPDISAVSYSSDGKTFKSTFWFDKPVISPSINNDTFLKVEAVDLSNYTQKAHFVNKYGNHIDDIQGRILALKTGITEGHKNRVQMYINNTGPKINNTGPKNKISEWSEWYYMFLVGQNKLYLLTSHVPNAGLNIYRSLFSEMQKSFRSWKEVTIVQPHFLTHNDSKTGFIIAYPDWWKDETQKDPIIHTTVFSPPKWIRLAFGNAINLPSLYDSQPDYISSIHWDQPNNWTQVLKLVAPHEEGKIADQKTIVNRAANLKVESRGNRSLDFSLDLSTIGYPSSFTLLSSFDGEFETSYKGTSVRCTVIDIASWVQLPPPSIALTLNPNSLRLVSGEEKSIQLLVNSSTDLSADITLIPKHIDNVNVTVSPNHLVLAPHEISSSTVHLTSTIPFEALDYIRAKPIGSSDKILRIEATDNLPVVAAAGNLSYTNNASQAISLHNAFASIILENPKSLPDQLKDMIQSSAVSASQMSGLLTAIIGIATGGSIIGRRVLIKKKKKTQNDKRSKSRSGSPF